MVQNQFQNLYKQKRSTDGEIIINANQNREKNSLF